MFAEMLLDEFRQFAFFRGGCRVRHDEVAAGDSLLRSVKAEDVCHRDVVDDPTRREAEDLPLQNMLESLILIAGVVYVLMQYVFPWANATWHLSGNADVG